MVIFLDKYRKTRNIELSLSFGEMTALARKNQGLTQNQISGRIGYDRSVISRWENGNLAIDPASAIKLVTALGKPELLTYYCAECPISAILKRNRPKPAA